MAPAFGCGRAGMRSLTTITRWAWRFHQDFTNFIGKTREIRDYCGDMMGILMEHRD
jgi:hypothetical protein